MNLKPYLSGRFFFALVTMFIMLALLIAASVRLVVSEAELSSDTTEDMVWLASQGQYEAVRFADALTGFAVGAVSPEDLKLRFDLLTSRIAILEEGGPHGQMEALGKVAELESYRATINFIEKSLEGLRPSDAARISVLRQRAVPLAQELRDTANSALLAKRSLEARTRELRHRTLLEILATLVATMVAGLIVAGVVVQDQRNMANAQAALERERQISKLHRAFIAVVSHQFRTPLAIIDASAQRMIRRGARMSYNEIASRSEKIRKACIRLTRLMESTLNAARLEEGEFAFTPQPCSLACLLEGVRENLADEEQGRIELVLREVPALVHVDPTLLEQAVQNLVSNALKYSPEGSPVLIDVRRSGTSIRISVTDRGVGVPADELASLFTRFFRARTAQDFPGTGIGLSLVAQVMDLHNGRVEVASVEGEGSTFSICFPCSQNRATDAAVSRTLEATI